jgi:hypothetical protein
MNDLFQAETPPQDYLSELVGEGKKFSDTSALARGKWESDNYIKTLERQMDELRQDFTRLDTESKSRASIEELLNQKQPSSQEPTVRTETTQAKPDPNYDDIFDQRIRQHEQRKREQENLSMVTNRLAERFGNDYQTKLQQTIDSVGLDQDMARNMARRSPEAFLKLVGVEQTTQPFQSPPRPTSLNSLQKVQKERTWSFYQELKKNSPAEYRSAKTNVQMHQDAQRLGEAFFDVD